MNQSNHPTRRTFLRAMGVSMALPLLDSIQPRSLRAENDKSKTPQRLVSICSTLGLHAPNLFPKEAGKSYEITPYLEPIKKHRDDFTVIQGLSHPEQAGKCGHSSSQTWLTAAMHPGMPGFRNTVSIDQLIAEQIGLETRFPSLQICTGGNSQSFTRNGIMLPADYSPSSLFKKLFVEGTEKEKEQQIVKLREGGSILDAVRFEAKRLEKRVAPEDRQTLQEYYHSVRETEKRLVIAEEWIKKPKPKVDEAAPNDIKDQSDIIGRMSLLFDLIPLIIQTDSTRLITVVVDGRSDVPPISGISMDHHNLSHHGKDETKLTQLKIIETLQFTALARLFNAMAEKKEGGSRLIDNTSILFGSNLGNANAHDTRNLPLILAGGRFKHGQHLKLDTDNNTPLSNLFVQITQQMGYEIEKFGSSNGSSVSGLHTI